MYTKKAAHNSTTKAKSGCVVLSNYEIIARTHYDTFRIQIAVHNRVQRKQF